MKDGFILFYVKDEKAHTVAMSNKQHGLLQNFIPAIFEYEPIQVIVPSIGTIYDMTEKQEAT